ncbi:MAG TPA: alpha/beta hydrolase [Acidimicrobiales bacterium]
MASPEFHAFQERMASARQAPPPADLNELRARIDATMGRLPLAEGTSAKEVDAGGVRAIVCARDAAQDDAVLLYFHGGGYRMASALAYRSYGSHLASACKARVVLVDYRLAPEHPFPAAVEDAVAAYRWLLDEGTPPNRIVVGGDSAGGGLTGALLLAAVQRGLPLPAGGVCLSPWADLTITAASYDTRKDTDKMFGREAALQARSVYLGDHDPTDPLASPVFGDWTGMPPLLIQVGDTESLLDDAARLASVASAAGVDVTHHVYPEMPHVWQLNYPAFPEAVDAVNEIAEFIARVTR